MKLINPEGNYSQEISNKIAPLIKEGYLPNDLCEWLINEISKIYSESLEDGIRLSKIIQLITGSRNIQVDFILFILFCYTKGYIQDINLPCPANDELSDIIFKKLISDFNPDFNVFFREIIDIKKDSAHEFNWPRNIYDQQLAAWLIRNSLINFHFFLNTKSITDSLYKICSEEKYWSHDDFSLDSVHYEKIESWGYWLPVLKQALDDKDFNTVYSEVDDRFFDKYFLKESEDKRFRIAEHYIESILELSRIGSNRHRLMESFSWLHKLFLPYFKNLLDLYNKSLHHDENLRILLRICTIVYRYEVESLSDSIKKELSFLSQRAIGNYRSKLKSVEKSSGINSKSLDLVNEAINFVTYFISPVKSIINLIQLLRNLHIVSVNDDLSFGRPRRKDIPFGFPMTMHHYPDQDPTRNIHWFPAKIEWILYSFLENKNNEKLLIATIEEISTYFGSRLRTRKGISKKEGYENKDFIEPDPVWRLGYIESIRALKMNITGKLHHILYFERYNDPDIDVREIAKKAYKEIRHDNPLPSHMEKVLTIRRAFWFLRQAHFVSLLGNDQLDTRAAQRTYSKEVERCKNHLNNS